MDSIIALHEGPAEPGAEARDLAKSLGLTATVAEWLRRSGYDASDATRRFLEPKLAHLSNPEHMLDRALAADRLATAIRGGEPIAVFGDYDCDGITSAAITTEILRELGATVTPLIASRFDGGYGVSRAACDRIVATGASLLVTCDCGSSDHASLASLRARGVEAIVIDHHLVPEERLPALAFLNPHRPECGFAYKGLASCGLALSLGAALRSALGKPLDLRKWLDLVAIGTIADVAPLDGDNRALVRAGLLALRSPERPGVRALSELAKSDGSVPVSARDVAFRLAPRLNAPGRLGPPDIALELLLARSKETALGLAARVEALSDQRRTLQETITKEAVAEIEHEGFAKRAAIVVGREGWNPGIVGIVAGRLADRFGLPVIVLGFYNGVGRGSVRGPKGVRLHDALSSIASVLDRFGGHQAAAGLEIPLARLPALREAFESAIASQGPISLAEPLSGAIRLATGDAPFDVVMDLERLEPCGEGNPSPRLILEGRFTEAKEVRGGHLSAEFLLTGGRRIRCFGISMGASAASLPGTEQTLVGELRRDSYRGGSAVELRLERVL